MTSALDTASPAASEVGKRWNPRTNQWLAVASFVWALSLMTATGFIWKYKNTPGRVGQPQLEWPRESRIQRTPGKAELVMIVHPKCACSRASIAELARLMATVATEAAAHVLFVKPAGVEEGWEKTDLLASAARIPGVKTMIDEDGVEAERFGAKTSGYTLLYRADGRLLFHGGITLARGHEGDNPGRQRITSLLTKGTADRDDSPTFGCDLEKPDRW